MRRKDQDEKQIRAGLLVLARIIVREVIKSSLKKKDNHGFNMQKSKSFYQII